ncbi:YceI family protein [Haloferula sp. BvORR071]|uniref:YceI family protein n=1 Tax=Haloferula sp. BvORR071 TaxID=1396141 RepID=UPI000696A16C|nr:YceI family protein [Haloferula sp. BvORR071]
MSGNPSVLSLTELKQRLEGAEPPLLVDVRLQEDCDCKRLPGAWNNCVYEVAFLERMQEKLPATAQAVCVYGSGPDSQESRVAAEKLCRAGYTQVLEFREGVEGWKAAGLAVEEGTPAAAAAKPRDGTYALDLAESRVQWTGRNLLNHHHGTLCLKSGELSIAGGKLTGGSFVFDMQGIACEDLAGDPLHEMLIAHLLSDDFFEVDKYPEASFKISGASEVAGATPGSADLKVKGVLTLKGIDGEIEFLASSGITAEGKLAAQAAFAIDRTRWNVIYGSGKFFRSLGGHLVNDMIELQLRMVTA